MRRVIAAAVLLAGCGPAAAPAPVPTAAIVRIALPDEPAVPLPPLVAERCTACHSGEMIANQPPLRPDQWAATVRKMREVYHAALAPADDAALVAALVDGQAGGPAPPP